MTFEERATLFTCGEDQLVAIVARAGDSSPRGVMVVVGGPQYRAGSHRQFTLLCRALAAQGITTMRFDYRGMGDSEGSAQNFEDIQPDIRAAVDHFFAQAPGLREVVVWGLCDAAAAGLMCAHLDKRITGLVLVNPWVRTVEGLAKARIKHYYWSRLTEPEFWRKLGSGEFAFTAAIRSFASSLWMALGLGGTRKVTGAPDTGAARATENTGASLPERMAEGMSRFKGKVLVILSGSDITAQEFQEVVRGSRRWSRLLADARVERRELPGANHTFSTREWRDQVARWTADWMRAW
jgi:exosortase A-associated hydrolase 1